MAIEQLGIIGVTIAIAIGATAGIMLGMAVEKWTKKKYKEIKKHLKKK